MIKNLSDLKILVIPEYDKFGGTLTFLYRLLEINKNNNIQTAILIQKNQQIENIIKNIKKYQCEIYTSLNRKKIFRIKSIISIIFDLLFCYKAIKKFKPDIIFISAGDPGILLGTLFFKIPIIYYLHTYPIKKCYNFINLFINRKSDNNLNVVTVSNYAANKIQKTFKSNKKHIEVIYNTPFIRKIDSNKHIDYNYGKLKIVLTIGHVVWYKNPKIWLEVAIKVIKKMPNTYFNWIGEGPLINDFKLKVQQSGYSNNISFLGYLDHKQITDYLKKSSIYFQPSLQESQCISVLDAMSFGIPCITSNVGGLTETIVNNFNGFIFSPEDVESFVSHIVRLLSDNILAQKIGDNGRKYINKNFSKYLQEIKIINLYKNIINTL